MYYIKDRVRLINNYGLSAIPVGKEGVIISFTQWSDGIQRAHVDFGYGSYQVVDFINLMPADETINQQENKVNIKEQFLLAITSEPQKSFRKAGITNGDDLLTDDGQKVFLSWLLKLNQDAFKKEVVDPILADMKDEKK